METAATLRGLRTWITNEYEHNGIRADGERVLGLPGDIRVDKDVPFNKLTRS